MAIASLGTLGGAAQAQQLRGLREQLFQRADTDRSGGLSRQEFSRAAQNAPGGPAGLAGGAASDAASRLYGVLDRDGNGSLTGAELDAAMANRLAPASGGAFGNDLLAQLLQTQERGAAGGGTSSGSPAELTRRLLASITQTLSGQGSASARA